MLPGTTHCKYLPRLSGVWWALCQALLGLLLSRGSLRYVGCMVCQLLLSRGSLRYVGCMVCQGMWQSRMSLCNCLSDMRVEMVVKVGGL